MISPHTRLAWLRRCLFVVFLAQWFLFIWIPPEQSNVLLISGFLATAALSAVMMIEAGEMRRNLIARLELNLKAVLNELTFRETFLILNARGKQVRKHSYFRVIFYSLLFTALFGVIYFSWVMSRDRVPGDPNIPFLIMVLYLLLASILFLIHAFRFSANERRITALTANTKIPIPTRWTNGGKYNSYLLYEVLKMFLG